MRRRSRSRLPAPAWGVLGITFVACVVLLAFAGPSLFGREQFELRAVFRTDAQVGIRSPVRIAGVDVGKVTRIESQRGGAGGAVVVMQLDRDALPIHADATAKVRSRLLLEGNFFIDLKPGRADSPDLASGATIPASRTSGPVQLDRVLSDLPADTRSSLRTVLQGFGRAIGGTQNGEPAAVSMNRGLDDWPAALTGVALTTQALRGVDKNDLTRLVRANARVFAALASRARWLSGLVEGLDRTMAATASRQAALRASIALLPRVLANADTTLRAFQRAFPGARAFARELAPGLRELPATIAAAGPWMAQATPLLSADELGGAIADLGPGVRDTAATLDGLQPLLGQADRLDRCLLKNLLPTGDVVIDDPPLPSGGTVSQEFFQTLVGIASAAQNFDGNGRYVRGQPGGGDFPVQTSPLPQQGPLRGNATRPPLGTRPAYPKSAPPFEPAVPCAANARPDLNSARTGGTP